MLTQRNILFIKHYAVTNNSAESARKAGYSEKTARSIGNALLTKVPIREAIERQRAEIDRLSEISREEIVRNLKKEANEADKSSDRIRANEVLAKIAGIYKENEQNVSIFNDMSKLESRGSNRLNMLKAQEDVSAELSPHVLVT